MPLHALAQRFGAGPAILSRAPGRVNLIGEHTDYAGGYVFPMAIDRDIRVACRPVEGRTATVLSLDFDSEYSFDLDASDRHDAPAWGRYVVAVADALKAEGYETTGVQAVVKGDVPTGAGLSSSAALEVATAMAFCAAAKIQVNREKLALLCRRAENEFVGVRCGIMDQFAALFCREGHSLLLNCTTLDHDLVEIDSREVSVVVCNSGVKHELSNSAYNERQRECAKAFHLLREHLPDLKAYHELPIGRLKTYAHTLPELLLKRARHVVTENERVLAAAEALRDRDYIALGGLIDASHDSLRDDYEVSCRELDLLVDLAREHSGIYGARLTGAGFGGCTINLVRPDAVEEFQDHVGAGYAEATGRRPEMFLFRPADGATVEWMEAT